MNIRLILRILHIVSLTSFCLGAREPRCPKNDFEEKVLEKLEKLVSIELQFERFKSEFNEAVAEMKAAKVDNEQYKKSIDGILANTKDSIAITSLERRINDTLDAQKRELITLQSKSSKPLVMFKAMKVKFGDSSEIIFTSVIHNHGESYNSSTGEFMVPVSGTYLFGITVCIASESGCVIGILVDDRRILVDYAYDLGNAPCFSYSTIEPLVEGQRVHVAALPGTQCSLRQQEAYRWNYFYGVLIA